MSAPAEAALIAGANRTHRREIKALRKLDDDFVSQFYWPGNSDLPAGRVWIGMPARLDILVDFSGSEEPIAPWVTMLLCAKSFMPIGWHFHVDPPSGESFSMAIRHGIIRSGKPEQIHLDLLRDPDSGDQACADSIASFLGSQITFNSPRRIRSKSVDLEFKQARNLLVRRWSFHCGKQSRPGCRPQITTMGGLLGEFLGSTLLHRLIERGANAGYSRYEVYRQDLKTHGFPPMVPLTKASQIQSNRVHSQIREKGASTNCDLGFTWWADWMADRQGESVLLAYNDFDVRVARVYEYSKVGYGNFIGTARLTHGHGWRVEK